MSEAIILYRIPDMIIASRKQGKYFFMDKIVSPK